MVGSATKNFNKFLTSPVLNKGLPLLRKALKVREYTYRLLYHDFRRIVFGGHNV